MYNPYNYHASVDDERMFFGHKETISRLLNGLSAPIPTSAAIFGGRRCGKTSLINKLGRELSGDIQAAGGRRFLPCTLDLQRGRRLACSDDFFLWVLEELGQAWELGRGLGRGLVTQALQTRYREGGARGLVDGFIHAFQSLDSQNERVRLVILVDESENIVAVEWGEDLMPNLRYLLSNSPVKRDVALVMAGSTQMYTKVAERDSPLANVLDRYPLPTLSHEATLALAREPNNHRLPEPVAEEVYRQTGGQPCLVQYILHELWREWGGELDGVTPEDVCDIADTFDGRTRHFSTWRKTLGPVGNDLYRFLAERDVPATVSTFVQHFSHLDNYALDSALDALLYHGLLHCHGRGKGRTYQVAGQAYRDWFLQHAPSRDVRDVPAAIGAIREQLENHFHHTDLEALCLDLDLDMSQMRRGIDSAFVNDIVQAAQRQDKLPQLENWVAHRLPDSAACEE